MVISYVPGHQSVDQGQRAHLATTKATKPPTYHLIQFGATLEQRANAASPQPSGPPSLPQYPQQLWKASCVHPSTLRGPITLFHQAMVLGDL